MTDEAFDKLMKQARRNVADMDKIDADRGRPTPAQIGAAEVILTAIAAVSAGIKTEIPLTIAEGLAMLESLVAKRRTQPGGAS